MSSMPHHSDASLPLRGPLRTHDHYILAHHLILHGYGHWLPNDPRGSGSQEIRQDKFTDLGEIHFGRKRVQPSREELKRFKRKALPRLEFPLIWFDDAKRQALGDALGDVVRRERYTVWGAAVLSNHLHLCIRRHRDDATTMWHKLANECRQMLCLFAESPPDHPVWSNRPYKVFLYTPEEIRQRIDYISQNPVKEGLSPQHRPFVQPYDGWPHTKKGAH